MKIKVQSEQVRKNIELFKLILKKMNQKNTHDSSNCEMVVLGFFNKDNGEVQFSELTSANLDNTLWQPLEFKFELHGSSLKYSSCKITKPEGVSNISDCSEQAKQILDQTLKNLTIALKILPKKNSVNDVIFEFSKINVDITNKSTRPVDVIYESWHQISRLACEEILSRYSPGTYLFRKDEFADILEKQLCNSHETTIKCVTLSYLNLNSQVCEMTLVRTHDGWLIYNDDPMLNEPLYPDIDTFLDNMKGVLKNPLMVEE